MKRIGNLYIVLISLLLLYACDTRNNIEPRYENTFIKLYGGRYQDKAVDFIPLDTGGFVILGSTQSAATGTSKDILVIITDRQGNVFLQKQLGDPNADEEPLRILQEASGFIICGNTISGNSQMGFLFAVNSQGDSTGEFQTYPNYIFNDMALASNGDIALTGVYENKFVAEILISRTDFLDISTKSGISGIDNGMGFKIQMDNEKWYKIDHPEDVFRILAYFDNSIKIRLSNLVDDNGFYSIEGEVGDVFTEPIDFIHGFENADNYYIIGYENSGSTQNGPVVFTVSSAGQSGNVLSSIYLSENNIDVDNIGNIMPVTLYKSGADYLLLGTELIPGSAKIRLLKLDKDFKVINDKSFGTGEEGDEAKKLEILPDGSVVFLATVNYKQGQPNTKIVLYKLTPDLELDY